MTGDWSTLNQLQQRWENVENGNTYVGAMEQKLAVNYAVTTDAGEPYKVFAGVGEKPGLAMWGWIGRPACYVRCRMTYAAPGSLLLPPSLVARAWVRVSRLMALVHTQPSSVRRCRDQALFSIISIPSV